MASFLLSSAIAVACISLLAFTTARPYGDPLWSNTLDDGSTGDDYDRLVERQIRETPVLMYTGSHCGMSRMSKELLDTKYPSLRYKYIDYDIAPGGDWMMGPVMRRSRTAKLPQIFICGSYIGGRAELYAYHETGQLASMIRQCTSF